MCALKADNTLSSTWLSEVQHLTKGLLKASQEFTTESATEVTTEESKKEE